MRDAGISQGNIGDFCTLSILLFRLEIQSKDTQIKYNPPIVTRLNHLLYFDVYIFQSFITFLNMCTHIFTLSIRGMCRDSINFAYPSYTVVTGFHDSSICPNCCNCLFYIRNSIVAKKDMPPKTKRLG